MAAMTTAARWFFVAAIAETISWIGLLIGMFFKYGPAHNAVGVQVFGWIHGVMFVFYLVTLVWTARTYRWSFGLLAIGALASIPPFTGWIFERWAAKRDREPALVG